jgi:arginyl-tRNA--protein-N-Asp/Glu arginylyltransferase
MARRSVGETMHLLERIVDDPHECAYLPMERANIEVCVMLDVSPSEWESLLAQGWRRFGPSYFRPACASCAECVSLRVIAKRLATSKSQRRAARACATLRRVVGAPGVDGERIALYAKWHAGRERERGWEFAFPHPCAREAAFYDDAAGGRLVGVGLFDETPNAISAAFFFYDPAYAHMSLGTANVLSLIADARAAGRAHVYLGFRVSGCASLRYKATFRPHELLMGRPAPGEAAVWKESL